MNIDLDSKEEDKLENVNGEDVEPVRFLIILFYF
jgi:hypothetical protein